MCEDLSMTNDVAVLYEQPVLEVKDGFKCPVCGKVLKTERGIANHMKKMDCYNMADIFGGKEVEYDAFALMKENNIHFMSIRAFRKSKIYSSALRFVLACTKYEIEQIGAYFSWIEMAKKTQYPNQTLSKGLNELIVREYRIFLLKNPKLIDPLYARKYKDDLVENPTYFIRSLEKALITFEAIFADADLSKAATKLPPDFQLRMEDLHDKVFNK